MAYGPTSPTPFAYYDPDTCSLRTFQHSLFADLTESSPTLPRWGSMRSGLLFERPMWVPRTDESGSSLLLGTPRCSDGITHPLRDGVTNPRGRLEDQVAMLPAPTAVEYGNNQSPSPGAAVRPSLSSLVRSELLPTPRATDGEKGGPNQRGSSGDRMLPSAVASLLPTPTSTNAQGNGYNNRGKLLLPGVALELSSTAESTGESTDPPSASMSG